MINVIRKQEVKNVNSAIISNQDINAIDTGTSVILMEAVKQSIDITYDELGYADVSAINLGVQYDHRVTWLHFNLDKLIWHLNEEKGYNQDTKYNYYTFKIAFTKVSGSTAVGETTVWSFDGVDFEIPYGVTKEAGTYKIVLMIEENQTDELVGNIKAEEKSLIERFVAAPIKGRVSSTFYNPELEITDTTIETDQEAALVKPKILCTLTDDGDFTPDTKELGQQYDNFIRYLKFNPRRITAHLNDFHVFAIFKQDDKFFYSLFEKTIADDPLDDYSESHPIIAWIPTGVYQTAGSWRVAIIAFTGNMEDINNPEEINGDYYFYVSKEIKMKVVKNNLTFEDVTKEPIQTITSNLLTEIGEVIITSNNELFQQKR